MNPYQIEALGDAALLIRFGERLDPALNRAAHAAAGALSAAALPGVRDVAAAYASVTLRYDPASAGAQARLAERVAAVLSAGTGAHGAARADDDAAVDGAIEIPVCYGGDFGPDLDALAAHAGLDPAAVVALHSGALYRVAMLGFMPGFPYLLGLDARLQMPRRASPRPHVPRGSVAIGGAQTGIYPRDLPGGWNLIGRTPLELFDPARTQPALLRPGQALRFRPIDEAAFAARRA